MPPADATTVARLPSDAYVLTVRQEPQAGKAFCSKGKRTSNHAVLPPPVVQLQIEDSDDPLQNYLLSPHYFMYCNLWDPDEDRQANAHQSPSAPLVGNLASSLHRLKDADDTNGGFFVFSDVSVGLTGRFRLLFALFELCQSNVIYHKSILSEPFTIYSAKEFPGTVEPVPLWGLFIDQGLKSKLPKKLLAKKRRTSQGQGGGGMQPEGSQQQWPDVFSVYGPTGCSLTTAYRPNHRYRGELQEPPDKRQRSVEPRDRRVGICLQNRLACSQAPPPIDPYTAHRTTGYGQNADSTSQQTVVLASCPTSQDGGMVQSGYMPPQTTSDNWMWNHSQVVSVGGGDMAGGEALQELWEEGWQSTAPT